jgi:hypothetical protein
MSIFASYWFWIAVAAVLGFWYLSRRGRSARNPAGFGPGAMDRTEMQDQHQGHQGKKGHGGCC